ncbi:MAG: stage II sporulation protein P [Peptococcaceae bacterium]|nr:stage II sporulation protein P [Peptococcaceae bacterium]
MTVQIIWKAIRKDLHKRIPYYLLVLLLIGCLAGGCDNLQKAEPVAEKQQNRAEAWLQQGWPLSGRDRPFSTEIWKVLTGTVPVNSYELLIGGIPVLRDRSGQVKQYVTEEEAFYASAFIPDGWHHRFEKIKGVTVSEEVQVLLYHTHNAETYLPSYGVSKVSGQNGGVVQAAAVLQESLQRKYGIRTVHSTTLHDYPDWNRSYQNSLATVKQLLQLHPDVKAVFDVHRDAGFTAKEPTTTVINGKKAARIMLVIGANHETWKENLAFARKLEACCEKRYPGLLRERIHIKETGRYNQQVHPHAVLLEIGSDLNTQEEADYALECFSQVIDEVLKTA